MAQRFAGIAFLYRWRQMMALRGNFTVSADPRSSAR